MRLAVAPLILAVLAALLLILAGPGTRLGFWTFGTGFLMMRWALYLGIAAAGLVLVCLLIPQIRRARGLVLGTALIVGLVTAWVPWNGYRTAMSLPPIHDITTDTEEPPQFVDVAPLRANASNPLQYPGEETAEQQRESYPEIRPLELALPADKAFEQALATAREQGWEIVATVPGEGRIEATATTFWFGFKDDVVIRIVPDDAGSRLDIRSKSRVGRGDDGANAARIREFLEDLTSRASG